VKSARHRLLLILVAAVAAVFFAAPASARPPLAKLLADHQPITVFDPSERFRPTTVDEFVEDSQLERLTAGGWVAADPDPTSASLPGPGAGVFRLNQMPCAPTGPLGGLDCYANAATGRGVRSTVYGRAVEIGSSIVLQYWYFYYDNTYSYFDPPSDVIWQAHEGDWELVTVVLDADGKGREVGYSQHCLGERRQWASTPRLLTHPIVFVASGSHANYFSPGTHPFDARCVPAQAAALLKAHGLPLPSDHAGIGDVLGPSTPFLPGTTLTPLNGTEPWARFPGFWGELQYFHSPFTGTVVFGTSPVGPVYHADWQDPLGTLATWTQS
jgi:hypothetical protein